MGGAGMKRTGSLKRTGPMKRRSRLKARGRARFRVSGKPDHEYRAWVRERGCVVQFDAIRLAWNQAVATPAEWPVIEAKRCGGRPEFAHVRSRGAGGTDREAVCLCTTHHREQHRIGIQTFQAKYAVDLTAIADRLWRTHQEGAER